MGSVTFSVSPELPLGQMSAMLPLIREEKGEMREPILRKRKK